MNDGLLLSREEARDLLDAVRDYYHALSDLEWVAWAFSEENISLRDPSVPWNFDYAASIGAELLTERFPRVQENLERALECTRGR